MILLHGTTCHRADQILRFGPDPRYREPGGRATNDGFSTYLESGPFLFGASHDLHGFPFGARPTGVPADPHGESLGLSMTSWRFVGISSSISTSGTIIATSVPSPRARKS